MSAPEKRTAPSKLSCKKTTWKGHQAVQLTTAGFEMIAVTDCGPRIAHFSLPGAENLFFWDEEGDKKRSQGQFKKDDWYLRGGHRLWASPYAADESAATYHPDNEQGALELREDGFTITGAIDPLSEVSRGFEVTALSDTQVRVRHFVSNDGEMLYACGLWGLSCTAPQGQSRYLVPLGDLSQWNTSTITLYSRWANQGPGRFDDDQFQIKEDVYVLNPKGRTNKRGLIAPQGIVAMVDPERDVTFVTEAAYERGGTYPADANIALYVGEGNFMVEMETMGTLQQIKPGERAIHDETWTLVPQSTKMTGADLRALLGR